MKNLIVAFIIVCIGYFIWTSVISYTAKDVVNNIQPRIDNFNTIVDKLK